MSTQTPLRRVVPVVFSFEYASFPFISLLRLTYNMQLGQNQNRHYVQTFFASDVITLHQEATESIAMNATLNISIDAL